MPSTHSREAYRLPRARTHLVGLLADEGEASTGSLATYRTMMHSSSVGSLAS